MHSGRKEYENKLKYYTSAQKERGQIWIEQFKKIMKAKILLMPASRWGWEGG